MKTKIWILLISTILSTSVFAREPIGRMTIFYAKKDFIPYISYSKNKHRLKTSRDISFKKGNMIAYSNSIINRGKYYYLKYCQPSKDKPITLIIPRRSIYTKNIEFDDLLLSDIGDSTGLRFTSEDGKRHVRIFKYKRWGYDVNTSTGENGSFDYDKSSYVFCLEETTTNSSDRICYCAILPIENNHIKLYSNQSEKLPNTITACLNKNSTSYYFTFKGDMLCDVKALPSTNVKNQTKVNERTFSLIYSNSTKELYVDGESFKLDNNIKIFY